MKKREEHKRIWASIANTVECIALVIGILVIIVMIVVLIVAPQRDFAIITIAYIAYIVAAVVLLGFADCIPKKPFLVNCLSVIFKGFGCLSISKLFCRYKENPIVQLALPIDIPLSKEEERKNKQDWCIEIYVLSRLVLSTIVWLALPYLASPAESRVGKVIAFLAGLLIFEIVVKQVNVLLFDARRKVAKGSRWEAGGYRRMIILLMINYIETILLFAIIYWVGSPHFQYGECSPVPFSRFEAFNLSFVTMTTFGQSTWHPVDRVGEWIILTQSAIGVFMALIVLAWSISLIPKPVSRDWYERDEVPRR